MVSDLKRLGLEKDNAERKLYLSKVNGLLCTSLQKNWKAETVFLNQLQVLHLYKKEQQEKFGIDETLWDKDTPQLN